MISQSALFTQYKDSFFLYAFRHLDRIRASRSKQLAKILGTELTYLYEIACLVAYKDIQSEEIDKLREWAMGLSHDFDVEQMKVLFNEKMQELNLRSTQPKNYSYTFRTLWDTIHFLALLIDDMTVNRDKMKYEFLRNQLHQMKTIFYNLFFKLDCPMCRDHYMTVKGFLIQYIERIELCLNRERFGETITWVDQIDIDNENDNVLMRHGMLYRSMVFHNHINEYRWIQRDMKPPINSVKMSWSTYKSMLELK
ncbi:P33 [Alphabaculovirus myunipunctae]|uniref:P33 n=1 Tax=Mythimna unipuncta nucleopolyhedrovirus TaxID=447897 RepID=A0A2K9VSD7_9ABAC|nr:P33 [Mythimna unipuncta nucleopolyhedrovirus]AUV65352.1 P33 [Mythimna unipuncta nucleopolyhedrovirus]